MHTHFLPRRVSAKEITVGGPIVASAGAYIPIGPNYPPSSHLVSFSSLRDRSLFFPLLLVTVIGLPDATRRRYTYTLPALNSSFARPPFHHENPRRTCISRLVSLSLLSLFLSRLCPAVYAGARTRTQSPAGCWLTVANFFLFCRRGSCALLSFSTFPLLEIKFIIPKLRISERFRSAREFAPICLRKID